jgi:hypothetical protein
VDADVRSMVAPLVTFLPGAALTMAVVELSAGEMVTGASRLVAGTLQLLLLSFGIVARSAGSAWCCTSAGSASTSAASCSAPT